MAATSAQTLFNETTCFACLPLQGYTLLRLGLIQRLMAAVPMQTLMDEAKCYACFGPVTDAEMIEIALLRRWLLSIQPAAETSAQALLTYTQCYACLGMSFGQLFILGLLGKIDEAT